jgi:protein SCO1/2
MSENENALPQAEPRPAYSSTLKYRLGIWFFVMAVIAGVYVWKTSTRRGAIEPAYDPRPIDLTSFELTERDGRKFKFGELDGQVWIASFFFSNCPSLCLKLNQRLAGLQEELAGVDVRFVSISVDPENDTPERLAEYAKRFKADPQRWLFVVPKLKDVAPIAEAFSVAGGSETDASTGHANITHSDRLLLVDRDGKMHRPVASSSEAELTMLVRNIKKLAAEKASPKSEEAPRQP